MFLLPSKNIACAMTLTSARCDIASKSWTASPKPDDCEGDWGTGTVVSGDEPGTLSCVTDTVLGGTREILAYGRALRAGRIVCASDRALVRCSNDDTGHGFTLSRKACTVFRRRASHSPAPYRAVWNQEGVSPRRVHGLYGPVSTVGTASERCVAAAG